MNNKYYNDALKQEFIDWKNETTIVAPGKFENTFKNIKIKEETLGKDCCNFTADEIGDYYKETNFKTITMLANVHSTLAMYTDWCFKRNLVIDGQNHYREIQRKEFKNYVNGIVQERREITEKDIDYIINEQLKNYSDKFIIRALWEGLLNSGYTDIARVQLTDFKEDGLHLPSGRIINYSPKLYELAKRSSEEDIYLFKNGTSNGHRAQGELFGTTVVRHTEGVEDSLLATDLYNLRRRFGKRIKEIFHYAEVDKWMTASAIRDAAIASFIKKKMVDGYTLEQIFECNGEIAKYIENQWAIATTGLFILKEKYFSNTPGN